MLKNKAPKWGNNEDYVDQLGYELANHFCTEVLKYSNPRGGRFVPGFFTHHQSRLGIAVRATPDGRKQGDSLAISLSPSTGTERKGPTGIILSASKIDQTKCPLGTSLDCTFYAPSIAEPQGNEKIKSLVKTYMNKRGTEFQINTLDSEILKDAQKNPDQYRDLVVRVWGFNAYFVTLKPEYQEEIIARVEH
jgi:formate C-acetyltransferase